MWRPLSLQVAWDLLMVGWMRRIDNWRRGLTTNWAELRDASDDPELRSLNLQASPHEVAERISNWAERTSRWRLTEVNDSQGETTSPDGSSTDSHVSIQLRLTRRTRVFRFVDDVHVVLAPSGSGTKVTAESRSRVGKGDLGQNRRNLKELVRALS